MILTIEVLNIASETKQSASGKPYVMLDVAFKNLQSGKIEGKKLVPFGDSEVVYKVFKDAKAGNTFEVELVKGEKYWNWTSAKQAVPSNVQAATGGNGVSKSVTIGKSTYETPEERAKKQVYIVKQSSIGSALELLSIAAKTPPSTQQVIDVAQVFTDWVLASPSAPATSFDDIPEDHVE